MNDEIIFGAAPRCGKTAIMEIAKETGISPEEIIKIILKNSCDLNLELLECEKAMVLQKIGEMVVNGGLKLSK